MPLDSLRDGFVRVCLDPSANVYPAKCRLLVEGQALPAPLPNVEFDKLYEVVATRDIEAYFGLGSVLSEGLKKVFECCGNSGVEIFALPRADAEAAVKAVYTLTITGSATTDGRLAIYMGESDYAIVTEVNTGDTAEEVAAAVADDVVDSFPFLVTAAAGVLTFTAKNGGTVGNCLSILPNWTERPNYAPTGLTFEVEQTVQGSINPEPLDYQTVLGECCYCCIAMLYDDSDWQDGMIEYIASAWSCDTPQCFGHGYTYNQGTFGQILANDTNSAEV